MLSKEQRKELNTNFYTGLKDYLKSTKSSNGRRINWLNYPSDVKDIYVRILVDGNSAKLVFDIQPKNTSIRSIIWEQMLELKVVLERCMTVETVWIENETNEFGNSLSRIMWKLDGVSLYNSTQTDIIYDFLKKRLIEFDVFYQEFKEILITLTK
jgi:hypothetical protein